MRQLSILLFTIWGLTSCGQVPKPSDDFTKHAHKKTDTLVIKANNRVILDEDGNVLSHGIYEPSINIIDFKKIQDDFPNFTKGSNNTYLLKKGFIILDDTINTETKKFTFINSAHQEILEVTSSHFREGDHSFNINYYLSSKIGYDKFLESLKTSKFKYSQKNKRYEIFTGTYSQLYVSAKGQVIKSKKSYYWIQYGDYQGKELSTPIYMEENFKQDTTKI